MDRDTVTLATEALVIAIVALFEEGLRAGVDRPSNFSQYLERARLLRGLADTAIVSASALRALARHGNDALGGVEGGAPTNVGAPLQTTVES